MQHTIDITYIYDIGQTQCTQNIHGPHIHAHTCNTHHIYVPHIPDPQHTYIQCTLLCSTHDRQHTHTSHITCNIHNLYQTSTLRIRPINKPHIQHHKHKPHAKQKLQNTYITRCTTLRLHTYSINSVQHTGHTPTLYQHLTPLLVPAFSLDPSLGPVSEDRIDLLNVLVPAGPRRPCGID